MSEKKKIEIAFAVDDQSVTKAKRSLTEILTIVERISKTMGGISGGGGGVARGGPFSFLTGVSAGGIPKPGGGGQPQSPNSIGAVFNAQARGLKEVAKASSDTSRSMAQDLRKAVDTQRQALKDLDGALTTATQRFKQLKSSQQDLINSMVASGASPEQARSYATSQINEQRDYIHDLKWKRHSSRQALQDAQKRRGEYYDTVYAGEGTARTPGFDERMAEWYGGTAFGRRVPLRDPQGRLFRAGVVGGAAVGGIVAGANEYQTQFFDTVSNEARQAQAFGSLGVSTKGGDLTYIAAALQVMRDPDKRREFAELAKATGSQSVVGGTEGLLSILQGNAGAVGSAIRGVGNTDTPLKEKLRSYMDQQIQSDPEFFDKLNKFQSEAGMRVQLMRRLGFKSKALSDVRIAAGEDEGLVSSAFESVRAGGFRFAQRNLFSAIGAGRAGLNVGDIGSLVAASAATANSRGAINELIRSVRVDLDPVAAEALAKGVAAGINSALFGAVSGAGLIETMRFGMGAMNPEEQARNMRARMGSMAGIGNALGGMDGAGHAINILSANRISGSGADIFQTNTLLHMMNDPTTLAALARGDVPPALAAQGITPEMAREMVASTTSWRARANFFEQPGARLTPGSKRMREMVEGYGGDIKRYLNSFSGKEQRQVLTELASAYTANSTFRDQDTAEGYLAFAANIGSGRVKDGKFKSGDAAWDSAELKQARDAAKNNEENYKKFMETNGTLLKEMSGLTQKFGETFLNMGKLHTNADIAAKSLLALADAADAFIRRTGGRAPERKGADQDAIRRQQLENEGKAMEADKKISPADQVAAERKKNERQLVDFLRGMMP